MKTITPNDAMNVTRMTLAGFSCLPNTLPTDPTRDAARSRLVAWSGAISNHPEILDSPSVQVAFEADASIALDLLTRAQWRAFEQATGTNTARTRADQPVVVLEQRTA